MKTATAARRRKSTNTERTVTEAKKRNESVPVLGKKKEESTSATREAGAEITIARTETTKKTKSVETGRARKTTNVTGQENANAREKNAATDPSTVYKSLAAVSL